jgi:hypothetical protein
VLFQNHDLDPGARQEKAEHHSGRPPADDTTLLSERRVGHNFRLFMLAGSRHRISSM